MEMDTGARKKIFETIRTSPGIHLRELERRLDMSAGNLQHHLHHLEKGSLILQIRDEQYVRYFVKDENLGDDDKKVLLFLRRESCRHILMCLLERSEMNNREISDSLGLSPSTVSWHLNKLVGSGIILKTANGRESSFHISEPDSIERLLVIYKGSFFDRMLDNFIDMWDLDGKNR